MTITQDDLHFATNDVALSLCLCLALHGCWQGAEARDKPFSSHHVIRLCNYVTSYLVFIRQLAFTSSYNSVIKNFIKIILPKRYLTCMLWSRERMQWSCCIDISQVGGYGARDGQCWRSRLNFSGEYFHYFFCRRKYPFFYKENHFLKLEIE